MGSHGIAKVQKCTNPPDYGRTITFLWVKVVLDDFRSWSKKGNDVMCLSAFRHLNFTEHDCIKGLF